MSVENIITTVDIIRDRLPEARRALDKLARKARRYGCPDIHIKQIENFEAKCWVRDWDGEEREVKVPMVRVAVTGEAPRIGDHEFLARVEITPAGNFVDTRPDIDDLDARFRNTDSHCDHCRTKRQRREVFVVRDNKTGAQLQIGRQCLRDYLGIDDPAKIAARFRFFRELQEQDRESWGFEGYQFRATLEALLSLAATCIRLFGWCSKGQAATDEDLTATASYVSLGLLAEKEVHRDDLEAWRKIHEQAGDQDARLAGKVIAWVREKLEANSDYAHNLKLAFHEDVLTDERRIGLVISAVASYNRAQEIETRRTKEYQKNIKSRHMGEVGERLRGLKVTQDMCKVVGENSFGEVVLVKFRTNDGNILSWFTGSGTGLEAGEQTVIDGTVKKHTEYNGIRETQLSRVKVNFVSTNQPGERE